MTIFFDPDKNFKLIQERKISFDEVIAAIENDLILDILEHPKQKKYKRQNIYVISIREYVYLVPFVIDADGNIFLKTIIPNRKTKQKYIKEEK